MHKPIIAAKGGSSVTQTAQRIIPDPESLRSREYARIIDIVSEGRIKGPANASLLQSVFLDGVPVIGPDGTINIPGVEATFRDGSALQTHIPGFPASESTTSVQAEVKAATPIARAITTLNANSVRVRVLMPAAQRQDSEGTLRGVTVEYRIDVRDNNGAVVATEADKIVGRTASKYTRQKELKLSGTGPWTVSVTRITADSSATDVQDKLYFDSFTEVIEAKLSRPNTALVALQIDATLYNKIPPRSYMFYGREIRVPTNFDPVARTYSGVWDGSFKTAWTDDPAWIWYDIATNTRYGMGKYADVSMVNKYTMYEISKFCSEKVPDGKGGLECRFSCNTYIQTAKEAYSLLKELASVFNAVPMYSSSFIAPVGDYPRDVDKVITPANVINGDFQYSGVSSAQRHTVVLVQWNDPSNNYKQTIEYVADDALIARWGVSTAQVTAIACTSRGQAQRLGRMILEGERVRDEIVGFTVGLDNIDLMPGMIVEIADPLKTGKRNGGRLRAGSTKTVLKLDKYTSLGGTETITVVMSDGKTASSVIQSVSGNDVTLATELPFIPGDNVSWAMNSSLASRKLWRVRSITETGKNLEYAVSCEPYDPDMQSRIDNQTSFVTTDVYKPPVYLPAPQNFVFKETMVAVNDVIQVNVAASWDPVQGAREYIAQWRVDDGNWITEELQEAAFTIRNVPNGTIELQVSAVPYITQTASPKATASYTIQGNNAPPEPVTGLVLLEPFAGRGVRLKWNRSLRTRGYTARVLLTDSTEIKRVYLGDTNVFEYSLDTMRGDGGPWRTITIQIRPEGVNGLSGSWEGFTATNAAPAALTGISASGAIKAIDFSFDPCADTDLAGYLVWLSTSSTFTPSDSTLVYDGLSTATLITKQGDGSALTPGSVYYLKAAAYDAFGRDALNVSSSVSATVLTVASGIQPGEITDALVAGLSASKVSGQLVDSQIGNVSTGKLLGQVTDVQIAGVNASKVAGQLSDSQIAAVSAAKVAGQLASSQLAGIETGKLIGQIAMTQLASDVQGNLNAAITTANQALTTANQAATATSVTQLTAKVDALNSNLLPVDLWKPNGQPLPAPWRNNTDIANEQALVSLPGPYGDSTTVLKAVAAGGNNDGGWDVDVKIDTSKAYRFSVWVKDVSGVGGNAYLGISAVQQGGVDVPNAYFFVLPKTAMTDGVWHLFVGYVYPTGAALPSSPQSAVYDGATGNVLHLGNDFNWAPYAEWVTPRCYQYYAPDGAEQWFAHPRFEVVDGREPSIAQLLSGAGLSVARGAITRVANVEAALPGKANVTDVTQLQARVGQAETNVQSALTRVGAVEAELPGKASAADVTSLSAKVNVRRTYNLRSSGNGYDGRYGFNQGLFSIDGAQVAVVSGYNRSYTVVTFNTVGNVTSVKPFDVYGSGEASVNGGAPQMAVYLDSLAAGTLVLIYTSDEPKNHRLTGGLPEAMYRCGASPAVFGSDQFQYRSVYALFGKAGSVAGSGQEFYKGGIDTDPAAFFSLSFEVINGEFVGISPGPGTQVAAALDRVSKVEAELPGKASATDLVTLQGRVTNAESNVNSALTRIGSVESSLPGKANASDLTQLEAKVSASTTFGKALNADPGCLDPLAWVHGGHGNKGTFVIIPDGKTSPGAIKLGGAFGYSVDSAKGVPCDPTKSYRISCWAKRSADSNSVLYLRYVSKDVDGSFLAQFIVETTQGGSLEGILPTTEWAKYEGVFTPHPSVKLIAPRVIGNWLSEVGYHLVQDVRLEVVDTVSEIGGLPAALAEKASQVNLDATNSRLSTVEATLPGKASASDLATLTGRVANNESNISSALTRVGSVESALPGKANASDVTSLTAEVNANKAASGNLIQNSDVEINTDGWWFYSNTPAAYNSGHTGRDTQPDYVPPGRHTLVTRQIDNAGAAGMWCSYFPVVAGRSYIASAYVSEHRAFMLYAIAWENAAGERIGTTHSPEFGILSPHGQQFELWPRRYFQFTAPPGAVRAVLHIVKAVTQPGEVDSWLFICNPMVEESTATAPSPYKAGDKVFNLASNFNATLSRVSNVEASVAGKASASEVTTLAARVGNVEGSVTSVSQSVVTLGNKVNTSYGVSLGATLADGRRKLSGFQALNDGTVSQFVITADQLLIQPSGSCINLDPNFTDAGNWIVQQGEIPEFGFVTSSAGASANTCVYARNSSGTGNAEVWIKSREVFPINANKTYRLGGSFYSDSGNGRWAYLAIIFYDSSGTMLLSGWGGSWSGYPWSGVPGEGQFYEYSGDFGAGTGRAIPANATQARVGVILNYGHTGGNDRRMAVQNLRLEEVLPSTLIQNGAITTDKLATNSVTAGKIAANSVNASHIQAGVITADKLLIGYGDNLVQDPRYFSQEWWGRPYTVEVGPNTDWAKSERRMRLLPGEADISFTTTFAMEAGATYRLEVQVYGNNAVGGISVDLHVPDWWYWSFSGGGHDVYLTQSLNGHATYATTLTLPASMGAAGGNIRIVNRCSSGSYIVGLISVTRVSGATLIQDGAIVTDKLAANAVTAGKIAANSINAGHIVAGTITTEKLVSNAVTSDKLAAGSVTADKLSVSSLSAVTANVGLLRTAASGARMEIESNQLRVYDANNVMRVRLGVW